MDLNTLNRRISSRREQAKRLETEIILACEHAASRGCRKRQLPAARRDWSRVTWNLYLAEALRMENDQGRRLRAMYHEIDSLERLTALPRAA